MKNIAIKRTTSNDTILEKENPSSYFSIRTIFCILYLFVHFIPDLGANDQIGPQWLYISILNLISSIYIFFNIHLHKKYFPTLLSSGYFIFFIMYLIWVTASLYYAINYTETLVCLSRIFTTFFAIFNLLIIINKDKTVIKHILNLLFYILLFESLQAIINFLNNTQNYNLDQLILSIYGNHGNKNILSASIVIKIPFALYYFYINTATIKRLLSIFVLYTSITALFILNTRSTFVSLFIYLFFLLIFILAGKNTLKTKFFNVFNLSIVLAISVFTSNFFISYVKNNTDSNVTNYTNVVERVKTIGFDESASSGRTKLWKHAIDYFKNHSIFGSGYGNWKLASIPYDKIDLATFTMSYHVHNDFIEILTETGLFGFIFYVFMFLFLLFYIVKSVKNSKNKSTKTVSFFIFLSLIGYLVDAFLNFPSERTIIQILLALISIVIIQNILFHDTLNDHFSLIKARFISIFSFIIIFPVVYINYQVYQSLKYQKIIFSEFGIDPKIPTGEVADIPLDIPNLSSTAFPIKQALARYYIRDKNYSAAIELINKSEKDNPYLFYGDFLKTYIYGTQGKKDSSYFYAKKAFYERPVTLGYFQNIMVIATQKKDTIEMSKIFKEFRKNRNESIAWLQYIQSLYYINGRTSNYISHLYDSAIHFYPNDSSLLKIHPQIQ